MADFVRQTSDGITLAIRLTPRAASDHIDGVRADAAGRAHLAARVRAVPEKGAANAALERLVAAWLDVPRSDVAVAAGTTQRLKTVSIKGDPAALQRKLEARLGGSKPG